VVVSVVKMLFVKSLAAGIPKIPISLLWEPGA